MWAERKRNPWKNSGMGSRACNQKAVRALKKGEAVNLVGFGKLSVISRQARNGVNPQTGKPMRIKARKVVKFTMGTRLKEIFG